METVTKDDLATIFFEQGDTTPDVCFHCEKEIVATFALRTMPLEKSGIEVEDVLVAVCPDCGRVSSIPAQSSPRLREEQERAAAGQMSSRVTHAADDAYLTIAGTLGTSDSALRSHLVTFYLRELQREPMLFERIYHYAHGTLARGRRDRRFVVRVQRRDIEPVRGLIGGWGVNESDLAIGIVGLAASDLLVDQGNLRAQSLRAIASSI
jgi:hypothetical protein